MKRMFLFLLLCGFSIAASAQDLHGFRIVNSRVVWQKVYNTDADMNQIVSSFRSAGILKDINIDGNTVTAVFDATIKYKEAGYSRGQVPMLYLMSSIKGSATIQFKDGRYRVTVQNIQFKEQTEVSDLYITAGEIEDAEAFFLKKRKPEFTNQFVNIGSNIIAYTFNYIFKTRKEKVLDDNW